MMMKLMLLLSLLVVATDMVAAFSNNPLQFPHRLVLTSTYADYYSDTTPTLIDFDEDAPRDISSMEQWCYEMGAQRNEGFALSSNDGTLFDVYAVATVDLPSRSPVLNIPEHMILSSNKAMAELRTTDMAEAEQIVMSVNAESEFRQYYLMLKLLVEYERGMESPWYQWLNSLPRYYTNAASMTPFCCLCLPSLMRKLAVQERGILQRLQPSIKLVPFLNDDTKYDVDLCTWVYQIVYTRSFESGDGDLRIVPLADVRLSSSRLFCIVMR